MKVDSIDIKKILLISFGWSDFQLRKNTNNKSKFVNFIRRCETSHDVSYTIT